MLIFRVILALLVLSLAAIRWYYAAATDGSYGRMFRLATVASGIYLLLPGLLSWSMLSLPAWVHWVGAALGTSAVLLFLWTHRALGRNWSTSAGIQQHQHRTLVSTGPYRWVRHPMYTTYFLWTLAFFLLSSNWLVSMIWLWMSGQVAARVRWEERVLLDRFGDQYREYMRRTGRFFPAIKMTAREL